MPRFHSFLRRISWRRKAPWLQSAQPYLDDGNRCEKKGAVRRALHAFRCAALLRPDWAEPHRKIGFLLLGKGEALRALPHLEQARRLAPRHRPLLFDLARTHLALGRSAAALACLARLHSLDPRDLRPIVEMALAAPALGDLEAVCHVLAPPLPPFGPAHWRRLGAWLRPRFTAAGRIARLGFWHWFSRRAIRTRLDAIRSVQFYGESLLYHRGDLPGAMRAWDYRRTLERELSLGLGIDPGQAPLRYLTEDWTRQIGHIAHIDYYAKMLDLGLLPPRRTVILSGAGKVANRPLLEHWKTRFEIIDDPRECRTRALEARLLGVDFFLFDLAGEPRPFFCSEAAAFVQQRWESTGRPHLLTLDPALREHGRAVLESAGIPRDAWFAALHVRESGFSGEGAPLLRNATIASYLPAIREITSRGGWVVRLGDRTMPPLPALPGVLDYPHSGLKSDGLDLFLLGASRCFVGVNSGPMFVPPLFGIPCVCTNWMPLATSTWGGENILIHKIITDRLAGKPLPYSRATSLPVGRFELGTQFESLGLTVVDNTSEEIRDAVAEMLNRLDGKTAPDSEDRARQARYRELIRQAGNHPGPSLGRKFLATHADLLD